MKIVLFGMAKDVIGKNQLELRNTSSIRNVKELKERLFQEYPEFLKLPPMAVAVNLNYARDEDAVAEQDEIVLIPPVSGG